MDCREISNPGWRASGARSDNFQGLDGQPKVAPQQLDLDHVQFDPGFYFLDQSCRLSACASFMGDAQDMFERARTRVVVFLLRNEPPSGRLYPFGQFVMRVLVWHRSNPLERTACYSISPCPLRVLQIGTGQAARSD